MFEGIIFKQKNRVSVKGNSVGLLIPLPILSGLSFSSIFSENMGRDFYTSEVMISLVGYHQIIQNLHNPLIFHYHYRYQLRDNIHQVDHLYVSFHQLVA